MSIPEQYKPNPSIPLKPCFACGIPTTETQSIYGIGHLKCFLKQPATNIKKEGE